jgi:hypothetical protein
MRLAGSWPITYWSRMRRFPSASADRSCALALPPFGGDLVAMMSLHSSMHSSQMNTDGPAISFLTSCWLLPQKEQ